MALSFLNPVVHQQIEWRGFPLVQVPDIGVVTKAKAARAGKIFDQNLQRTL